MLILHALHLIGYRQRRRSPGTAAIGRENSPKSVGDCMVTQGTPRGLCRNSWRFSSPMHAILLCVRDTVATRLFETCKSSNAIPDAHCVHIGWTLPFDSQQDSSRRKNISSRTRYTERTNGINIDWSQHRAIDTISHTS